MFDLFRRENSKAIHVNDMDPLIGKVELIDIREPYEYSSGSLRTAKNIPMGELLDHPEKYLKKEETYYLLCRSGTRSKNTCKVLDKLGYDVVNVSGGMISYLGSKRS